MTTILYGAGASYDFFEPNLCTQYLTDKVKIVSAWQNALTQYFKKDLPSASEIVAVIDAICQANPKYDFEQICEVLDKYCSYQFDDLSGNTYLANIVNVLKRAYGVGRWSTSLKWGDVPFVYRQIIADTIIELQNNHKTPNYQTLIEQQNEFLQYVCKVDDEVSIASLNYDDIVFTSAKVLNFETGFELTTNPLSERQKDINIQKFLNAKKVVYFPHGHIRFRFINAGDMLFYDDYNMANQDRWEKESSFNLALTYTNLDRLFSANYNTFLTTGQTKDNSFNISPYSYYYQRLSADILRSQRLIIIGYSFGDEHINRLFSSFVNISRNNIVYIVDYYLENSETSNLYKGTSCSPSTFTKINSIFKESRIPTKRSIPIDNDSLGFKEIMPNIIYYRKGYHKFLEDYDKMINKQC